MSKTKYFDSSGKEIDERSALDNRGVLRDGCTMRVPLQIRDTAQHETERQQTAPRITDGSNNPFALNKPGFRVRAGDNRQAVKDALAVYEAELTNRWRNGDSDDEDYYSGTGTHHGADSGTRHRQVDQAYQEYDSQLANAWRQL